MQRVYNVVLKQWRKRFAGFSKKLRNKYSNVIHQFSSTSRCAYAQTLWAFGRGDMGQLGTGDRVHAKVPQKVAWPKDEPLDVKQIAAGWSHSFAVLSTFSCVT